MGRRSRRRTCAACLLELLVVAKVTCGGCGGQATLQLGQELDGVLEAARLNWVDHGILGQLRLQPRLDALREEGERRIVRLACARMDSFTVSKFRRALKANLPLGVRLFTARAPVAYTGH